MKEYILITGASTGIGAEIASQLAKKGYNLVLVARSLDKLETLKTGLEGMFKVDILTVQKDLSSVENARALYQEIKEVDIEITMLVNNAGVGVYGNFLDTSLDQELDMIELNISSLVALTKLFAKDMMERKSGRIMNVASLLSFLPFPYYSV